MEQYFALKYYEEVAGWIITGVLVVGIVVFPFAWAAFDAIKKWWRGDKK